MKGFERGIGYYTRAQGVVKVAFPEDRTVCQWCKYARNEDSLKRWRCVLTDEYLIYPFTTVGNRCPLELIEKEE